MAKKIISVGFEISHPDVKNIVHTSQDSLLDADIVIFDPDIGLYIPQYYNTYKGKPSIGDHSSFLLTANSARWRDELHAALVSGKTVVVMMSEANPVFVDTGQREYSGTGRNSRISQIVQEHEPYSVIPISALGTVVRKSGERMKAVADLGILSNYWNEYGGWSVYQVYLDGFKGNPLIVTQTGDKTVAAVLRVKDSGGALILLPPPDLDRLVEQTVESLRTKQKTKSAANAATKRPDHAGKARSIVDSQFVAAIIDLDKAAHADSDITPPPTWVDNPEFVLAEETIVNAQLSLNQQQLVNLRTEREELIKKFNEAVALKSLLFGKGKQLEDSILTALNLLGFTAQRYEEGESEFDAVFVTQDGKRLIGEAEGKDVRAINVDKLDQLDRNLREDFARSEVNEYAKGVLFGNAERFKSPAERDSFFTEKCVTAAKRSNIALVRTTDLYDVARYLKEHNDLGFAGECRKLILETAGEVTFPPVPTAPTVVTNAATEVRQLQPE